MNDETFSLDKVSTIVGISSHLYHPGWCKISRGGVIFFEGDNKMYSIAYWCKTLKELFLGGVKARTTFF